MQEIKFCETRLRTRRILHSDKFELRTDRKFLLLQKILFWILRKLKCYALTDQYYVETHVINTEDFMKNLYIQSETLLDFYHLRGERLLLGQDEYRELTSNPELQHMFSFNTKYGFGKSFCDMAVTAVPWMKGILVLPKGFGAQR